jgi:hypothetical protein
VPVACSTVSVSVVAITPDTKDWTWVLERQCPDCGFEASAFARNSIGQIIRDNADAR